MVSGLPGSGKSWLATRLAPYLDLPVIDKDEILDRLFDSQGVGDSSWRRNLSRQSDDIFRREAEASNGALLVSFWRLRGMPADSGTPTDWLMNLSTRIVHLHCECPAELAAARFARRQRHPGHLDNAKSPQDILATIQQLASLKPLDIGQRVPVDTSAEIEPAAVADRIRKAWTSLVP